MKDDYIEHQIRLSDNMTVLLNIKIEITPLELLAITKQAEILLKAASKEIIIDKPIENIIDNVMTRKKYPEKIKRYIWEDSEVDMLKKIYPTYTINEILRHPTFKNFNRDQIMNKAFNLKLKKSWVDKPKKDVMLTDEQINHIRDMINKGNSSAFILESMNLDKNSGLYKKAKNKIHNIRFGSVK